MSANAAISSKRASICALENPSTEPFRYTFSRPVNSGLKPEPSSSRAASLPLTSTSPGVGESVPAMICRSVPLPLPLRPRMPTVSPLQTWRDTSRRAQNSLKYWRRPNDKNCSRRSRGCAYISKRFEALSTEITRSQDIGEPFPRFLEPCETQHGDRDRGDHIQRPGVPGNRLAPEQHIAPLFDDQRQRADVQEGAIALGQDLGRIEDRRQEHEHRGDDADELRDIAQIHAQRSQEPAQAQ